MKKSLIASALFACSLLSVGCGTDTLTATTPETGEESPVEMSSQNWLDLTLSNASIAVDASSPYPNDIVSQDSADSTGVVIGEISGPALLRTFPDSPFEPVGVSEENLKLEQYSFIVLPVTAEADTGSTVTEVWIELGLVESPQEQAQEVLRSAPTEGTQLVAAGTVYEGYMVLPAAHGLALSERDGSSAVAGRGQVSVDGEPVALRNPTFAEIEERTRLVSGLPS